jgi:hypothetical protein
MLFCDEIASVRDFSFEVEILAVETIVVFIRTDPAARNHPASCFFCHSSALARSVRCDDATSRKIQDIVTDASSQCDAALKASARRFVHPWHAKA